MNILILRKVKYIKKITIPISIGFLIIGLIFFFKSRQNNVAYTTKKSHNYTLLMTDNSFYDSPTSLDAYPSRALQKINLKLSYNFQSKNFYKFQGTSTLSLTILGTTDDNKKIYEKTTILKKQNINQNTKQLNLVENVSLDYATYVEQLNNYEQTYNLNLIKTLKIKLDIKSDVLNDEMEVLIPISRNITEIKANYEPKHTEETKTNQVFLTISLFLIISSISIIFLSLKIKPKDYLFKLYNDLIIKTQTLPNLENLTTFTIYSLKDLINLAKLNNTHIIYAQETSSFYLIVGNYLYIYKQK